MKHTRHSGLLAAAFVAALLAVYPQPATAGEDDPAVYLLLVENAPLPFDAVAAEMQDALISLGWQVLAPLDCGVDAERCEFRTRVLVAQHPVYTDRVMEYGFHAAYAAAVRFAVFEDENGVHVSATNPMNLNRTIVDEETTPEDWLWASEMIRDVGKLAFPDHAVVAEYGQRREKARIGRTFGIMAGGKFTDKIETVSTFPEADISPAQVAELLASQIELLDGDWEWDLHPIYVLDLPEHGVSVLGLSGGPMESRAFSIVGAGGNDARKDFACPGIAYAPAFPVEVVIANVDGEVQVSVVDEMYRMKMFFEDAGKMAFAKNMGMPGSIEGELKKKIEAILN